MTEIKNVVKTVLKGGIPDISYSDGQVQKLDLYIPKKNIMPKLILFIHGGGFVAGDKSNFRDLCASYRDKGYITASVGYTLLNGVANPSLNCFEILLAVAKIKDYLLKKKNITIESMATYGVSAGSNLALLYAYKMKSPIPVKLTIGKVPPVTFDPDLWQGSYYFDGIIKILDKKGIKVSNNTKELFTQYVCGGDWKACSPVYYNPIPTMCTFGLKDVVVPTFNRAALINKMEANPDIDFYYTDLPNSGHCCDEKDDTLEAAFDLKVEEWLKKYL